MRWIGERSYGIYLWQTPVIVFSQGLTGRHGWRLDLANVSVTLALAALSWTLVEDPIRRCGFRAAFSRRADPSPAMRPAVQHQLRAVGAAATGFEDGRPGGSTRPMPVRRTARIPMPHPQYGAPLPR